MSCRTYVPQPDLHKQCVLRHPARSLRTPEGPVRPMKSVVFSQVSTNRSHSDEVKDTPSQRACKVSAGTAVDYSVRETKIKAASCGLVHTQALCPSRYFKLPISRRNALIFFSVRS